MIQTNYLYCSPMWSVEKANSSWILTTGYPHLNKIVPSKASAAPDVIMDIKRCNKPRGLVFCD